MTHENLKKMEEKEIESIHFTTFDRYEVSKGMSSVEVFIPSTVVIFEKNNTLHDSRMGAFNNVICSTCRNDRTECPGHMGHIKLHYPVLNPFFTKTTLKKIVDSFCFKCFNLLKKSCICGSSESSPDNDRKKRKLSVSKPTRINIRITFNPSNIHSSIGKLKFFFYLIDGATQTTRRITTLELYKLLTMIPKHNYLKVFPAFKNFTDITDSCFIHNLPVIPTICRPPNKVRNQWNPHHLTNLYSEIIKKNIQLQCKDGVVHSSLLSEYHAELQSAVNILFDMNLSKGKRSQTVLDNGGIRQRIDGKTGRLRGNLMGKRVNFSARTVLSGDPNLGINEIGIPTSFAENLTVPVKINRYNIDEFRQGKYNMKYICKNGDENKRFDLSINNYDIEIGDIVERCLINGDIVAVNRQPTLHRGSMIACYVRIFPCSTLRMNYSTMIPLNADTDGDELNVHVPQDLQSKAELENLMLASTNIVCSQNSEPLIGLSQDSLLGSYLLSKELLTENDFFDILYKAGCYKDYDHIKPDVIKPRRLYTGIRFVECLLDFFEIYIYNYEQEKANFKIIDNRVISGRLDKYTVGTCDNTIIHQIYLRYGHIKAANFIFALQKIANEFLNIYGFSVGISDCIIPQQKLDVDGLNKFIHYDIIHNKKYNEEKLLDALSYVSQLEPPEEDLEGNRMVDMIKSGAKGSMSKFMQITSFLGQQFEESDRIKPEISHNTRVLPHFKKHDLTIESRGFVKNSFISGLSPAEFFLHSIPSRITLIDTACKTSVTGAQYRRLVKCLERVKIIEDDLGNRRVVDTSTNNVIQFNYGEDDFQGEYMKSEKY